MSFIVIADSHNLCREALCDYIRHASDGLEISGAEDYESLQNEVRERKADLVLIDTDLPGIPADVNFPFPVAWMTGESDAPYRSGPYVRGIFPKNVSSKEFLKGIEDILAGRPLYIHAKEDEARATTHYPVREFHLSAREKEVAAYLARGASNKEIARALDLQVVTIKLHVRGICRKLNATNRTQAALIAKEHDLV